jgi:hypothetical protein
MTWLIMIPLIAITAACAAIPVFFDSGHGT